MRRAGHVIFPLAMLLTVVGFNGTPALWIPLTVVFVVIWIMGIRSERKSGPRGARDVNCVGHEWPPCEHRASPVEIALPTGSRVARDSLLQSGYICS